MTIIAAQNTASAQANAKPGKLVSAEYLAALELLADTCAGRKRHNLAEDHLPIVIALKRVQTLREQGA